MPTPGPAESWLRRNRQWFGPAAVVVFIVATEAVHFSILASLVAAIAVGIAIRLGFLAADRLR